MMHPTVDEKALNVATLVQAFSSERWHLNGNTVPLEVLYEYMLCNLTLVHCHSGLG